MEILFGLPVTKIEEELKKFISVHPSSDNTEINQNIVDHSLSILNSPQLTCLLFIYYFLSKITYKDIELLPDTNEDIELLPDTNEVEMEIEQLPPTVVTKITPITPPQLVNTNDNNNNNNNNSEYSSSESNKYINTDKEKKKNKYEETSVDQKERIIQNKIEDQLMYNQDINESNYPTEEPIKIDDNINEEEDLKIAIEMSLNKNYLINNNIINNNNIEEFSNVNVEKENKEKNSPLEVDENRTKREYSIDRYSFAKNYKVENKRWATYWPQISMHIQTPEISKYLTNTFYSNYWTEIRRIRSNTQTFFLVIAIKI